ncbi:MAG: hypothetical protein P4M15_02390 [Alphaproteobacteria bacterium]|nr:hypothetical protein [Alphaproteobacteria bacterium]
MQAALRASSLAPNGFVVESVSDDPVGAAIMVRPAGKTSQRRDCGPDFFS